MKIINKHFVNGFYALVNPIGGMLERAHIHPHFVTVAGLVFSVISGILFWKGQFVFGGIALILSGACDVLDGRLARNTAQSSKFGALFDSTIDRYSEVAVFLGLAAFYNSLLIDALIIISIAGSILTSYVRARAEGLGLECKIGLMQRPERITFIAVGSILGPVGDLIFKEPGLLMKAALLAIALLANFTVLQRVLYVRKLLKQNSEGN